jgi:hypothetical protein
VIVGIATRAFTTYGKSGNILGRFSDICYPEVTEVYNKIGTSSSESGSFQADNHKDSYIRALLFLTPM